MSQFLKKLCHQLCSNLFDNSVEYCQSKIPLKNKLLLFTHLSTEEKVNINRKINGFCRLNKNRFWVIYYRLTEKKIDFSCKKCNKFEGCQNYILKRIIKYIKAFDSKQESNIFKEVRKVLLTKESIQIDNFKENERDIIRFYIKKINRSYKEKSFDLQTAIALTENILIEMDDRAISIIIKERLQRYQLYGSPIILQNLFIENSQEELKLKDTSMLELLTQEKFVNYIKKPLNSRYIDFLRSSEFIKEINKEVEENRINTPEIEYNLVDEHLKSLSNRDRILYKLRYGFRLSTQEFLHVSENFNSIKDNLSKIFNTTEKLYLKFLIHYNLDEESKHFTIFHKREEIKESIVKKLSKYREEMVSNSYRGGELEELAVKLIYNEPLKAKELGKLLGFTDKEIYKEIEKIKKRLKKLEKRQ